MSPSAEVRSWSRGQRLRQARVARGLTQSELADSRFSKPYVSQLERDRLRPTEATLRWLAERLDMDANYLATGVDERQHERVESAVARAEAAVESHDDAAAIDLLAEVKGFLPTASADDCELKLASAALNIPAASSSRFTSSSSPPCCCWRASRAWGSPTGRRALVGRRVVGFLRPDFWSRSSPFAAAAAVDCCPDGPKAA